MFSDNNDLFPDFVNLGTFCKQLLTEITLKIKAYNLKKEILSKDCSVVFFPGVGGCSASEIRTSEQLLDLFGDIHRKHIRSKNFVLEDY